MEVRQVMRRLWPATRSRTTPARADETKVVLSDYYTALQSSGLYSGYRSRPWPVERAVAEAYERVVWVYKSVEAISGHASQLPFRLRQGEEVLDDHPLYRIMNKRANPLETGRQFRKRLSAQLLLSKRGAFVEVTRSRGGDIIRLDLLPPGRTMPIAGIGAELISHYEVIKSDGTRTSIDPENVRWFRDPHPLDAFSGVTPLEAAGLSVELDFFARLFNVSFLKNDARPGGVLAVNGEMDEESMNRIESRFGRGPVEAGKLTVIAGEVSYVDMASQPRDLQHESTANISKREILTAFGVPESVIGDASGRCLRASELVRLADGSRVPAGELAGTRFELMTSTPDGHVPSMAWATLENVEPIYRLTTESGRILETNGKHPLYAATYLRAKDVPKRRLGAVVEVQGWTPVAELADRPDVGQRLIAVPSRITPAAVASDLTPDQGFVLGALVGDGSISSGKSTISLSTPEGEFSQAFTSAVEALGDQVTAYKTGSRVAAWGVKASPENRKGSGRGAHNACRTRALLRRVGLEGTTSHTKFIPEDVFGADDKTLAAFLSGLFAADGCVSLGKAHGTKAINGINTISLVTVNELLARDVQEALLRFGVNARLRHRTGLRGGMPSMRGKTYASWEVAISAAPDLLAFAESIRVPGKQDKLDVIAERARAVLAPKARGGNVKKWRTQHLNPNLRWEKVVSVEQVGIDQTVGIAVPGHHTYLSLMWEHNTWDNAEQELHNFWTITMPPLLGLVLSGLDEDSEDELEGFFDTTEVEVLQKPKKSRREEARTEFEAGLISIDEYRAIAGYEAVDNEHTRALYITSGKTPIPTSEQDAEAFGLSDAAEEEVAALEEVATGQVETPQVETPDEDVLDNDEEPADEATAGGGSSDEDDQAKRLTAPPFVAHLPASPIPERFSVFALPPPPALARPVIHMKRLPFEPVTTTSSPEAAVRDKLETALSGALTALSARFIARVVSRLSSPKARKGTRHWASRYEVDTRVGVKGLDVDQAVDAQRWQDETEQTAHPIVEAAAVAAAAALLADFGTPDALPVKDTVAPVVAAIVGMLGVFAAAKGLKLAGLLRAQDEQGASLEELKQAAHGFTQRVASGFDAAAVHAATATVNGARTLTAQAWADAAPGRTVTATWNHRGDALVRRSHQMAGGQVRPLGETFQVGQVWLRYPGDEQGPPQEVNGCRCWLSHRSTVTGRFIPTPEGAITRMMRADREAVGS